MLHLGCVLVDADAAEPRGAFEAAARVLQQVHGICATALADRLCRREQRGSSAIGNGVALPHVDMFGLTRPHAAYLRLRAPVLFGSNRRPSAVQEMLVLVAPRPATGMHHAMLLHYRRLLSGADFLAPLRACRDAADAWWLFREHEWEPGAVPVRRTCSSIGMPFIRETRDVDIHGRD